MPGETDGVPMRTSRFAEQLAADDAKRIAEHPPEPRAAEQSQPSQGPRYVTWRPWYERLMAKGCNRCDGEPPGWVQKQIQTSYRFKRFVLWSVNLIPRSVSLVRVLASRSVSSEQYAARMASCGACPSAVIQLRVVKGEVHEASYCGQCECPKWYGSRNAVRNKCSAWRCPAKRHAGSDRDAVFTDFVRAKTESTQENGGSDNGR